MLSLIQNNINICPKTNYSKLVSGQLDIKEAETILINALKKGNHNIVELFHSNYSHLVIKELLIKEEQLLMGSHGIVDEYGNELGYYIKNSALSYGGVHLINREVAIRQTLHLIRNGEEDITDLIKNWSGTWIYILGRRLVREKLRAYIRKNNTIWQAQP